MLQSAIHRSFALGDNLADISAKGQVGWSVHLGVVFVGLLLRCLLRCHVAPSLFSIVNGSGVGLQAQTVVADNLGLAVAVCISHFCHGYPRVEKLLPLVMYPVLTLLELYAIFHQLQAVHLQTLNKVFSSIFNSLSSKSMRSTSMWDTGLQSWI